MLISDIILLLSILPGLVLLATFICDICDAAADTKLYTILSYIDDDILTYLRSAYFFFTGTSIVIKLISCIFSL